MATDQQTDARDEDEKDELEITSRLLPDHSAFELELNRDDTLENIVDETLRHENVELPAPKPEHPLDQLYGIGADGHAGPVIPDLAIPLWQYLRQPHTTRSFGVELVLAIRVNKRWRIAPEPSLTPRAILQLFDLNGTEYSLYMPDQTNPLPPDTAISLKRGEVFEAQKDGKYGA
ncbi:MAG: hypothetical protein M3Z65_00655 [Chloroflexota bacterium]|nr:hypothetical protein [Chloroflexota bacterium]